MAWKCKGVAARFRGSGLGATCYVRAAQLGCISALSVAAQAYEHGLTSGYPQSYAMAAYWFQMDENHSEFSRLLRDHPFECTPWGIWDARDLDMQVRIMMEVRQAQFSWMCVAKRMEVPKGVALIICGLVCTPTGWNLDVIDSLATWKRGSSHSLWRT